MRQVEGVRVADHHALAPVVAEERLGARPQQRRGLQRAALVSVQGSQGFWQHHGYAAYTLQDAAQRERLSAYGRDAVYMMRRLDGSNL